jgi:hypothetical protein
VFLFDILELLGIFCIFSSYPFISFNWKNITNSQNSVRKISFGGTFSFSNCFIIGLDTGSLVLIVFVASYEACLEVHHEAQYEAHHEVRFERLWPSFSTKMSGRRFRRHQRCFYVMKVPKKASKRSRLFFVEKLGLYASIMQTLCMSLCKTLCSAQGMPGGCQRDAREMPGE